MNPDDEPTWRDIGGAFLVLLLITGALFGDAGGDGSFHSGFAWWGKALTWLLLGLSWIGCITMFVSKPALAAKRAWDRIAPQTEERSSVGNTRRRGNTWRGNNSPWNRGERGDLPYHGRGGEVRRVDQDTIYLWQVRNTDLYKVGITSERRGVKRIEEVAKRARVDADILCIRTIGPEVRELEKRLQSIGSLVDVGEVDGRTEFRRLSDRQVQRVIGEIERA